MDTSATAAAAATTLPVELFSTQGVMITLIAAVAVVIIVILVFFLLKSAIANLKIKTQNLELSTEKQNQVLRNEITVSSENAEQSLRTILQRQNDYIILNTEGLFDELWSILYSHNQELLVDVDCENAAKLFLEFALSTTTSLIVKFNNENHIPDDPKSLEEYAKIKTAYIYNHIRNFYSAHSHLLPSGIDVWSAFSQEGKEDALKEYIYRKYYDMLTITKKIRKQYLDVLKSKSGENDEYARTLDLLK